MKDPVSRIKAYHERTKHHLERYARGPGGMDWHNQPDPFRTFAGCDRFDLPLGADLLSTTFGEARLGGGIPSRPLDRENLGVLLELSLGLSAWKSHGGSSWALRCNPSSGNLHPTEGYVFCAGVQALPDGLYHYVSRDHVLERRAELRDQEGARAIPEGCLFVGLSSIHWREAWKYGERAFRYCQHDVGHALAAVGYAAASLGWRAGLLADWGDGDLAAVLGLDRVEDFLGAELENPDALLWVGPSAPHDLEPGALLDRMRSAAWFGRANRLSPSATVWAAIEEASAAATKPRTDLAGEGSEGPLFEVLPPLAAPPRAERAADLIRRRRSAQAFDGRTAFPGKAFFGLLDALLPRPVALPSACLPWLARIHLLLFVHRVEGVPRGLYLLPRSRRGEERLRVALGDDWLWEGVPGCPAHVPLHHLLGQDVEAVSRILSCHQDIASESAFSLGMIAEFAPVLKRGAWWYRRLFWEAGVVGQGLYLEAESAGFRGTGIGCFFDDEVHRLLGLEGEDFQSLYHFTVGSPREDARLKTLPPYEGHESR